MVELYLALLLMAASQFVMVSIAQSVIDGEKHNFLVSLMCDICLGMALVWTFHRVGLMVGSGGGMGRVAAIGRREIA